jgi:N-acetylglutamate synthase-like GNAT family acetyltransferase
MDRTHEKIELRTMRMGDLPPVLELVNKEGWEYELVDMERILEIDPENSVVALAGKEVVGLATTACHRNRGVLGHVIVKEGWRKTGIGKRMMVEVLRRLDAKGIGIVELYSVPHAMEFYTKLDFRKISDLKIYKGKVKDRKSVPAPKSKIRKLTAQDLADVVEMDTRLSGFDRSNVIAKLMLPFLHSSVGLFEGGKLTGFALGRMANIEAEIGPWIMEKPDRVDGLAMIAATMDALDNRLTFIEIPGENPLANSIIEELGFEAKSDVHRFVRTKLKIEKFCPAVMSYAALEFG